MKIVKSNIFDVNTKFHHGQFVITDRTQEVVECFLCEDRDTSSMNSWNASHHGWRDRQYAEDVFKRYIRLYKVQPTRWAYIKDKIFDDPDVHWVKEAVGIYHR